MLNFPAAPRLPLCSIDRGSRVDSVYPTRCCWSPGPKEHKPTDVAAPPSGDAPVLSASPKTSQAVEAKSSHLGVLGDELEPLTNISQAAGGPTLLHPAGWWP